MSFVGFDTIQAEETTFVGAGLPVFCFLLPQLPNCGHERVAATAASEGARQ